MEENSGDPESGGNTRGNDFQQKKSSMNYRKSKDDNSRASSSRHGYHPRNKGQHNWSSPYQNGWDPSAGFGYGPSYAASMSGMPFNGESSYNTYWDSSNFQAMPFLDVNGYAMNSWNYQAPSRQQGRVKKPIIDRRGSKEDSASSDHSTSREKVKQKGRGGDEEQDEGDDAFERLSKRNKEKSTLNEEVLEENYGKSMREIESERELSRKRRAESPDVPAWRDTRRRSDRREDSSSNRKGKETSPDVPAWRDTRRRRRSRERTEGYYSRRKSSDDEEEKKDEGSRSGTTKEDRMRYADSRRTRQRRVIGKDREEEGDSSKNENRLDLLRRNERQMENGIDPRRNERLAMNGKGDTSDGEDTFHRSSKSYGEADMKRDNQISRDRVRSPIHDRLDSNDSWRKRDGRSHRNRERERERREEKYESSLRQRLIVPLTPPRDGSTHRPRAESFESRRQEREETRSLSHRGQQWREQHRLQHEDYRSQRMERDHERVMNNDEVDSLKKKASYDDAPPSDAMQAAMEAALGVSIDSIVPSDVVEPPFVEKREEEDQTDQSLRIIRARPDEVYEQVAQVGEGTYGQVFKAKADKTGVIVALKKIRMESEKDGFPITALREIKILQGLRHENVVRLHEMLLSKNSIYMVFEYLEHDLNGILSQSAINFTAAHLKSLAKQLLAGLAYLHHHSILHRDLKGSNLLLHRDGTLKLADFGLARRYTKRIESSLDYTNRVVTLWYRPPELLFGETCYNDAIDVWGAGCIFLELFTRKPVFQGNDEIHQVQVLFELLGPIQKQDWPEADTLPWYDLVRPMQKEEDQPALKNFQHSHIYEMLSKLMPSDALEVAAALLSYNPSHRVSAMNALRMDYFASNLPKPEKPREILENVTGEWHEFESRQARRGVLPPLEQVPQSAEYGQMGPPHHTAGQGRGRAEIGAST